MKKQMLSLLLAATCWLPALTQVYLQSGTNLRIQPGTNLVIQGDVNLEAGSVLINSGTILLGNNSGYSANFNDQTVTSYQYGDGRIIFNSTMPQLVSTRNVFGIVEMNGYDLQFGSSIAAAKWYLNAGKIHTYNYQAITTDVAELAIEASPTNINFSQCWFEGSLRRFIAPATVNQYTFPVGLSTGVNVAEMGNLLADPLTNITYIDASFQPKAGTDAGLVLSEAGTQYIGVHNAGVWRLTRDGSYASGKFDLRLYTNGFTGLSDNLFAIVRRPDGSSSGADWTVPAGSSVNADGGTGRLVSHGFAQRNNLSTFSEFGIGMLATALPVSLNQFNVKRQNTGQVLVNWQTQTEQHNSRFDIERRLDHETDFTVKGAVPSKASDGTSVWPIDYSFTDNNTYDGISYYRLKQVDIDGRAWYSLIKAIGGRASINVLIWPNPSDGQFSIRLEGINGQKEAFISDLSGRVVQKFSIKGLQQVNIHALPAGTYVLTIPHAFGNGAHFKEKVMVVR